MPPAPRPPAWPCCTPNGIGNTPPPWCRNGLRTPTGRPGSPPPPWFRLRRFRLPSGRILHGPSAGEPRSPAMRGRLLQRSLGGRSRDRAAAGGGRPGGEETILCPTKCVPPRSATIASTSSLTWRGTRPAIACWSSPAGRRRFRSRGWAMSYTTAGLRAMDYLLADRQLIPPGAGAALSRDRAPHAGRLRPPPNCRPTP